MNFKLMAALCSAFLLAGCLGAGALIGGAAGFGTSGLIKDSTLQQRAAFALGVDTSQVKISNRENSGIKINFTATVGKKSNQCYVTSSVGVVSDAICSGGGKTTCNELLKKAGKC